jgi:hypothetical protein
VNCTDENLGALLADYYSGQLPPEAWLAVELHVAKCDACRKSLVVMMALGGGTAHASYRSGHVSPEQLVSHFRADQGEHSREHDTIRRHLDACELCRREYQFLIDLDAELEAAALADPARASRRFAWRAFAARPVVAWAMVALFAYPALSWLVERVRPAAEQSYAQILGPVHRLYESRRGTDKRVEIARAADQLYLRLAVPMYALPDEMDYRFEFMRTKDKPPAQPQVIANFDTQGQIDLLVDASVLADGEYILSVLETERGTGAERAAKSYAFTLTTHP